MRQVSRATELELISPFGLAVRSVFRSSWYLATCLLLSAMIGAVAAYFLHSTRHTYVGKLLFRPVHGTEPYYASPELQALSGAIVSPTMLKELHKKWDATKEFADFRARLNFQVVGDSAVDVTFASEDKTKSQALLQDAMKTFVIGSRQLRLGSIENLVQDFESEIALAQDSTRLVAAQLQERLSKAGIESSSSLNDETVNLRASIAMTENLIAVTTEQDREEDNVALMSFDDDESATSPSKDLRQRQQENRMQRDKEAASFKTLVDAKQKEFDRFRSLHDRNLISDSVFGKAKSELESLKARQSQTARWLEIERQQIDEQLSQRTRRIDSTQPRPVTDVASKSAADSILNNLNKELSKRRDRLVELTSLQREVRPALRDLDSAQLSIEQLQTQVKLFKRSLRSNLGEVQIVQDARPMNDGVSSNAMQIFAAGMGGSLFCLIAPMFLVRLSGAVRNKPESTKVFGLPVLGRKPTLDQAKREPEKSQDEFSRIALRICQQYDHPSGVITLVCGDENVPDPDGQGTERLVKEVANRFRCEGKSVMVVRGAHLESHQQAPIEGSESLRGSVGKVRLERVKSQNDYVLVTAPLFEDPLELENATSHSDAVVFVVPARAVLQPKLQRVIADTSALRKPILGVVLCR